MTANNNNQGRTVEGEFSDNWNVEVLSEYAEEFDLTTLAARTEAVLAALDLPDAKCCVFLTHDVGITALNLEWRKINAPTDVLSFPMEKRGEIGPGFDGMLGDIAISVETAQRMMADAEHKGRVAQELGIDNASLSWSLVDEVTFLMVHSALHLVGHDHAEPNEEKAMKCEECRLMEPFLTISV